KEEAAILPRAKQRPTFAETRQRERPANRPTELMPVEFLVIGRQQERVFRVERIVARKFKERAAELVRARLRDHLNLRACRASVLCRVCRGLDAEFLNRVWRSHDRLSSAAINPVRDAVQNIARRV